MSHNYDQITAICRTATRTWEQALELCQASRIDVGQASKLLAELKRQVNEAEAAGLLRSASDLREVAERLAKRLK